MNSTPGRPRPELRGVSFEWNEASASLMGHTPGQRDIGVIAQEIEAVFPELVTTSQLWKVAWRPWSSRRTRTVGHCFRLSSASLTASWRQYHLWTAYGKGALREYPAELTGIGPDSERETLFVRAAAEQ